MSKETGKTYADQNEILSAYESIFKAIQEKRTEAITSKNRYSKAEALQEVMAEIWEKHPQIETGKVFNYIRRAIGNKLRDDFAHEQLTGIFCGSLDSARDDFGRMVETEMARGYGLSDQYILQLFRDIQALLTDEERSIWKAYAIDDQTAKTIGESIGETEVSVCRKLKRIFNKIASLKIAAFTDSRYVSTATKKRAQVFYAPHQEDNGETHTVPLADYQPTVKRPVMKSKHYQTGIPQTVFTKSEYDARNPKSYVSIKTPVNAERAYILKTWAQVWKQETAGIVARPEMDYIGPADKMTTFRLGNALMMSN
jgi:hypothetical protein